MLRYVAEFRRSLPYQELLSKARARTGVRLDGLWGGSFAFYLAALIEDLPATWLVVAPHPHSAEQLAEDLRFFCNHRVLALPQSARAGDEESVADVGVIARSLRVLHQLHRGAQEPSGPLVIVAPIEALMTPVCTLEYLNANTVVLRTGDRLDRDNLAGLLVDKDFRREIAVEGPGQFSIRGGIIDVYPYGANAPVRIELFGESIESLRTFDAETQRSGEAVSEFALAAVSEHDLASPSSGDAEGLLNHLPPEANIAFVEPAEAQEFAEQYEALSAGDRLIPYKDVYADLYARAPLELSALPLPGAGARLHANVGVASSPAREIAQVVAHVRDLAAANRRVVIFCDNAAEEERFSEMLADVGAAVRGKLDLSVGRVSEGFVLKDLGIAFATHRELFHRYTDRRPVRRPHVSVPVEPFADLAEGDAVVHSVHGIAVYRGTRVLTKHGATQEYLTLEFADHALVYVPAAHAFLVRKYLGVGKRRPPLSRVGTGTWSRQKEKVAEAASDLASELLALQAERALHEGIQFPADTEWQREFEASFIYQETEDQLAVMEEIKRDMEGPRPMDRLICGDVGYGKTELAMRCAFKAATALKQVAVLVPTTVLAEQHYRTFTERMADYPINIAVLSRFKRRSDQQAILEHLKDGTIDIVIGTHRLVQKDVEFADLGLLIIDEEQRFGVLHKEHFKKLRSSVDVLTMTATPIPRTLHMSLIGLRDISSLETPPLDRTAIHSEIVRFDADVIRSAVLRELSRQGQVFFVHNRIYNIQEVADRLARIVPECRIGIGHGQMHERELEQRMLDFVRGRIDVLVATTIIESGLDIPNANTILINRADQFGLADLHQLRGRVGRYKNRAYAYFLLPERGAVSPQAAKRIRAIEDFSELGAGFKIAMRDLEIRGAGNILGSEQSGHIAAVGYHMYVELLKQAIARMRNEAVSEPTQVHIDLGLDAVLPESYVSAARQRVAFYDRLSQVADGGELSALAEELRDRFGPLPEEAVILLRQQRLRLAAGGLGVSTIAHSEGFLMLTSARPDLLQRRLSGRGRQARVIDEKTVCLRLPHEAERSAGAQLAFAEKIMGLADTLEGVESSTPSRRLHAS